MVSHKGSTLYITQKTHKKTNGQITGGRKALKCKGKGTKREVLSGKDKIEWYRESSPLTGVMISLWG